MAAAVVAAVLAVSAFAFAMEIARPAPDPQRAAPPVFHIRGRVSGLYPGKAGTMSLKIRNSYRFPISVRQVASRVGSPAVGCPGRSVTIRPWRGRLLVPAHGRRRIAVRVRMRPSAPSACIGARYPIAYSGRAVKA